MKMYPQLAIKDSIFNKTFRDLYAEESRKNPEFFTKADWPLVLAHRTADMLTPPQPQIQPQQLQARTVPSMAETRPSLASPTPSTNPLERGAYNQVRSPYWYAPWIRTY